MLTCLYLSATSISMELQNSDINFSSKPFDVFVNGVKSLQNVQTNVFSLFGLKPNEAYTIEVFEESLTIHTLPESECIDVSTKGIIGDSLTNQTSAIQQLIDTINDHGRLYFPQGDYLTGPLFLKSHITIELAKGAVLRGLTSREAYPILPSSTILPNGSIQEVSSWEGESLPTFASLITGVRVEDVHIIGQGILDGNGQNGDWWLYPKDAKGGAYRPKTIFLSFCDHITLHGIQVQNSPSWTIHPYFSNHVQVIDCLIMNPKDSPNTDGCNPESCTHVEIIGVDFSVGDDCIAIKSGKYTMGMTYKQPSSDITIRNCRMQFGHGAIVLGSEMSGGIKDLSVRNCLFVDTDRGLRVKTRRGRGNSAIIDGIVFEHIRMDGVLTPLVINMFYNCDPLDGKTEYVYSKEVLPIDHKTPYLGTFTFRDISCVNVHVASGFFYGLPEQPIQSIVMDRVSFEYAPNRIKGVPAMMSFLEPMEGTGLHFYHVKKVQLHHVECIPPMGEKIILFESSIEDLANPL